MIPTEHEDNFLDKLLRNHETHVDYLRRRYDLGSLSSRSAEATPPKREGDPFSGLAVRFVFARGTVTYTADSGTYDIVPAPQGWKP